MRRKKAAATTIETEYLEARLQVRQWNPSKRRHRGTKGQKIDARSARRTTCSSSRSWPAWLTRFIALRMQWFAHFPLLAKPTLLLQRPQSGERHVCHRMVRVNFTNLKPEFR